MSIYIPIPTCIKKRYKVIKITHEQYLTQNVNGETQEQKEDMKINRKNKY